MKQMSPEKLDAAVMTLTELLDHYGKMIGTLGELRRLLMLAKLEPRVVEGKCGWFVRDLDGGRFYKRPKDYQMVIRYGKDATGKPAGETVIPLEDVPREFWPEDVLRAVQHKERAAERRRERIALART